MEKLNLNSDPRLEPAPGKTAFDYGVAIAQVGAIVFPALLPGVKFFDLLTAPLRGKRMSDWCEELRLSLNELSQKMAGLTPEALAASDPFISAFALATQAALRTHHAEKLEALRNAVLNVAAGTAPEDHYQTFFLNLVDSLTPTHILMLRQFKLQSSVRIIESPEWLKSNVASQIAKDLLDRGLIGTGPGHHLVPNREQLIVGRDGVYTFHAMPTLLGSEFLSFITDPAEKK
jgi:hypothetical protein